jgi:hypothetical protein
MLHLFRLGDHKWQVVQLCNGAAQRNALFFTRGAAMRRYARGVRSVIPWTHVADRLMAAGVEVEA